MLITDKWLQGHHGKPHSKVLERADRDGLSARVSKRGKIIFQMRYQYGEPKTGRRLDIGTYPQMTLKEAREETARLRKFLDQGKDPKFVRALERTALHNAQSLEELFRMWHVQYCQPKKVNAHEILRTFEIYVFPVIGELPGEEVTMQHWLPILDAQAKEHPAICERILTNGKQMLRWCRKRQFITRNVLSDLFAKGDFDVGKPESGVRYLSESELEYLWLALNLSQTALKHKLFMLLVLFYGCRNGELRKAKKKHFNFQKMTWRVPPENHKLGRKTLRPIMRPIIPEIVPVLMQLFALSPESEFLFPRRKSKSQCEPETYMTKSTSECLPFRLIVWIKKHTGYEMEHWSMHVLRKTARTYWSSLTEHFHIPEIMLGHTPPKPWRIYDGHYYIDEQAIVYRAWWARLFEIFSAVDLGAHRMRYVTKVTRSVLSLPPPRPRQIASTIDSDSHDSGSLV